jgi:hypothetical protein
MGEPKFKIGQKILFQHPENFDCEWLKGKITELIYFDKYFWGYAIAYRKYKKGQAICRLSNETWIKHDNESAKAYY